jgi:hypothetical protein
LDVSAVDCGVECDHGRPAGGVPGDLHGVLDRLGARVEERGLLGARDRRDVDQALGQLDVGLVRHDREVGVQEAVDLGVQGLCDRGIGMPHVQAADSPRPVEEGVAVDIGDDAAVCVVDHERCQDALGLGDHALLALKNRAGLRSRQLRA